ncbi:MULTISPECIES: MocR-like pyridoxine biosynthesis transcription factor PdxR [Inquilinus]|uniref:GntR family transcriptional regulator/MocR family aminotransferase n=1 Tax=Inquilinus ginsengisoli TaxID=363840 RepID=A0ABU1JH80_9PROT|nr:PLP-dependent aminotransferase family protein [Inquilinus ginsengisoli]MDR6287921.1 GntR family transcriptional regulator/MocR family aminotransferase [Inquilinus ginsengisoli]
MTTLHLPLDRSGGLPLHRQIYDGIRGAILAGALRPGQRIPSTRALALDLAVSRLPVLAAYEQLLHECYLEGRAGSGTYVSQALPDELLQSKPVPDGARPAPRVPPESDYGGLGPFRTSLPALDRFPHVAWARLVARHAQRLPPAHMAYGDPAGLPALRAAIADHLRAARGVRCSAEQVLIVSGSQAALRIAAAAILAPGDAVAVEEPGYPGARAALAAGGARLLPIPVDEGGIDVDALRRAGGARAAYVTPSHQYPLGMSMTAARRLTLLDWARRQGAWVLEDDYDSEYRYVSRPLGALQGMDAHGRVIYVGTFSKVMFPALRVGYLVVPPPLLQDVLRARLAFDLFPPTLYQSALAEFLDGGHFVRHLRRMRGVYQARRAALLDGLARHCGDRLVVHNADAGLHVAVLLPDGFDDTDLVRRMGDRGLTATALSTCYASTVPRCGLLLGFGGSDERRLQDATRMLGELLRAYP